MLGRRFWGVCRKQGWLFIIRGRAQVMVEYQAKGQRKRVSLSSLPHRQGRACRYRGLFYQGREKEPVDIIVYREGGFKEPWF